MTTTKPWIVAAIPASEIENLPIFYRQCAICSGETDALVLATGDTDSPWLFARNANRLPFALVNRIRSEQRSLSREVNLVVPMCEDLDCLAEQFEW